MPLPFAIPPVATIVMRYMILLAVARFLARNRTTSPVDHTNETTLDRLDEGAQINMTPETEGYAFRASGRASRVIRPLASRIGLEIDVAALGRLRIRRVGSNRPPIKWKTPAGETAG